MEKHQEDIKQDSGTIFFFILFFLFALIFSDKQESKASSAFLYSLQNEMAYGNIQSLFNATLINDINLPEPCKNCVSVQHNTNLSLFSIQNKVSYFNLRTDQYYINNQKKWLQIEPTFLWKIYYLLPLSGKSDPPVLG